jgi:signal transduction histidine kinase
MSAVNHPSENGATRLDGNFAELKRQNASLRDELKLLRLTTDNLSRQLALARGSITADREARRAALNLMEDAVLARRSEHEENQRRQVVEKHLRELHRRKDEFLATLSHELRNPLATIKAGLQLLCSPKSAESTKTYALDIVNQQADHMQRLIDDVLEVSRIIEGKISIRPQPTELQKLIRQAAAMIGEAVAKKPCHFQMDLPDDAVEVMADPVRITQVFANILSNAVKYCDAECHVDICLRCDRDMAVATFRDQGLGIAPDLLPHIFDLFVQSHHSLERSEGGLGLGLSVVRNLVEMHGGRVEAFSDGVGQGSEFRVYLPTTNITA